MASDEMSAGKRAAWLATLWAIAAMAIVLLAVGVTSRETNAAQLADIPVGQGASTLSGGIARVSRIAARALSSGDVTTAAVAMDGAMRAAEVGRDGAAIADSAAFAAVLTLIQQARRARQDGRAHAAATLIARAASRAAEIREGAARSIANGDGYDGARLLDASGFPIGVLQHVPTQGSDTEYAMAVIGGHHDVLGFLNFGGTRTLIPAGRLVLGKARTVGSTLVVLLR
jgi:hypothetical protein